MCRLIISAQFSNYLPLPSPSHTHHAYILIKMYAINIVSSLSITSCVPWASGQPQEHALAFRLAHVL